MTGGNQHPQQGPGPGAMDGHKHYRVAVDNSTLVTVTAIAQTGSIRAGRPIPSVPDVFVMAR